MRNDASLIEIGSGLGAAVPTANSPPWGSGYRVRDLADALAGDASNHINGSDRRRTRPKSGSGRASHAATPDTGGTEASQPWRPTTRVQPQADQRSGAASGATLPQSCADAGSEEDTRRGRRHRGDATRRGRLLDWDGDASETSSTDPDGITDSSNGAEMSMNAPLHQVPCGLDQRLLRAESGFPTSERQGHKSDAVFQRSNLVVGNLCQIPA